MIGRVNTVLVWVLAGCYSPTYRDCEVTCSAGACPSGLQCDTTLGVCRPEGAGGACPAPIDDANVASDVPSEGSPQRYCATTPNALLCHDFDIGTLVDQGWNQTITHGGGTVGFVTSTRSSPNALESFTPTSTAGVAVEGRVSDSFTLSFPLSMVSIAFDMNFAARENAGSPQGAFALVVPGAFTISFVSSGSQGMSVENSAIPTVLIGDPNVLPGTWSRYELRFVSVNNQMAISVFRDAQSLGSLGQVTIPPAAVPWELHVGAAGAGSNGVCRFHYDNIVVTVTP